MSTRCPSCQAEISADAFGLITCSNCGAQIMAGMEAESAAREELATPTETNSAPNDAASNEIGSAAYTTAAADAAADVDVDATVNATPEAAPDAANLSDIAEYGNSPISQAREGGLRFHVHLANIDTADVRKAVRELLSDSRFLFDVDGILNSIQNGMVKISDVTPVKAAILIQRLRALPVDVTWEQYAIVSTPPNETNEI